MALQNVSVHRRASLATSLHSGASDSGEQKVHSSHEDPSDHSQLDMSSVRDDDSVVDAAERKSSPKYRGGEVYSSTTQVELPMPQDGTDDDGDQLSPLASGHTVRRSASQTVLATITTVVKVNDDRERNPHNVRSRSSSRASATTHTEHHNSRVSLVPMIDERFQSEMDVTVGPPNGSIKSADGAIVAANGKRHGRNGIQPTGVKPTKKSEHRHNRSLDAK